MQKSNNSTQKMVLTAVFAAITILMANVPFLGYIPLGVINATTIHIPVIIGAVLLGPASGAFLGFVFGLTSFVKATFQPTLTSFCFTPFYSLGQFHGNFMSIVIAFVPRIMIGIVAYYVFVGVKKLVKGKEGIALAIAGIAGSLTNTILVMGGIYLFFGNQYSEACAEAVNKAGALYLLILSVVGTNGVPEAIVCAIIVTIVGKALLHVMKR